MILNQLILIIITNDNLYQFMDSKTLGMSFLVVFLMASSGAVVLVVDDNLNDDTEVVEEVKQVEVEVVDNPPKLLVESEFTHSWDGDNATADGFVYDETPQMSTVNVVVLDGNFETVETYVTSVNADGYWLVETQLSEPGYWILEVSATDRQGQNSESKQASLEITKPFESEPIFNFRWDAPSENETTGSISGYVIHEFPETCEIEYRPKNQSSAYHLDGAFTGDLGMYNITFDTSTHNTEGILITECGMFQSSQYAAYVILPMPPEPVGDYDNDAVLDDVDECPTTPEGEPVYSTGCSDSETDDDGDNVMNDRDQCPSTPSGESVDYYGCSDSQKDDDLDGLTNNLDVCPNTPTGEVVDSSGCSDSQKDDDGDGVTNDVDTCPNTPPNTEVNSVGCSQEQSGPLKILALHGGGQTANGLRNMQGIQDLMNSLSEFEFVFASTPENNNVWIRDPPGGKGEPTTDRDWADASIDYLDQIVEEQGPFYAILGYSQGAAMIPVYLANTENTFNRVMMYNGYLPTTHEGLIDTIDEAAPFSIPAMVFSGENDDGFKDMAPALAAKFSQCLEVHSQTAGHNPPYQSDSTYSQILNFIRDGMS